MKNQKKGIDTKEYMQKLKRSKTDQERQTDQI